MRPSIALYFTDKPQTRFPLLVQLENDDALIFPPGASRFLVTDDFTLPMDVDILAVYPHAHYLGKLLEAYATLPRGKRNGWSAFPIGIRTGKRSIITANLSSCPRDGNLHALSLR